MTARRLVTLLLLAWALVLAHGAWDRGPDPWIDFGRELYVPWRITEGDALHRDLSWFNGPLSAWWNAAWMGLLGVSFDTLQWVNLGLALVSAALLHGLIRRASDRHAADLALLLYFPVFAFAQQKSIGNYSFLAPYSHCIVHGFVLALIALTAFGRARRSHSAIACLCGGLALGGVFLTKAEVFVAATGASAIAFIAAAFAHHGPSARRVRLRMFGAAALGFSLALGAAWLRLRATLPVDEATRALLGTWVYALNPDLSSLHFYREMRGEDAPVRHIHTMLRVGAGIALFAIALAIIARIAERLFGGRARRAPAPASEQGSVVELALLAAVGGGLVIVALMWAPMALLARPLPLLVLAVALVAVLELRSADPETRERGVARFVLAAFSGLLALKLGLKPTVRDYGFVLAAPGITLALATLSEAGTRRMGAARWRTRALIAGATVALAVAHWRASDKWYERRRYDISSGGDHIAIMEWRGDLMQELLDELDRVVPANGTMLVLPEGVSLNYLLRRPCPIAIYNFMPPELIMYGEERIVADLRANQPDVVVLAHKETKEYGYRFFGQGYGEHIMAWLMENYREVDRLGVAPLTSYFWGASIYVPK
ncbi:MAG: hypothetical protein R3F49_06460 [Planctomycetota bacterium]